MAYRVGSSTYAAAPAYIKALIDGEGASALLTLDIQSQWFNMLSAAGNSPDAWEPYYVSEIALRVALNTHPDTRWQAYTKQRNDDRQAAFDYYAPLSITYDPSATTVAYVYNVANNRRYCLNHCVRLKPALMPSIDSIDAAGQEVMTMIWNRMGSNFRRRPVTMNITRTAFTGGTWTESTKTISGLTGVGTSLDTGTAFYVTGGTNATTGEYVIGSTTSTTVVLNTSLGSTANGSTDIAGFYYVVTFSGIEASEAFDSLASVRWYYTDSTRNTFPMSFVGPDDFAVLRARDFSVTSRPMYFRTYLASGNTTAWRFSPPPDTDYQMRGEILVRQPGNPSSETSTTTFAKFATEYQATIRRATLSRVLTNSNRHNEVMAREVAHEIESLFPIYQETGDGSDRSGTTDVYGDYADMRLGMNYLGGPL